MANKLIFYRVGGLGDLSVLHPIIWDLCGGFECEDLVLATNSGSNWPARREMLTQWFSEFSGIRFVPFGKSFTGFIGLLVSIFLVRVKGYVFVDLSLITSLGELKTKRTIYKVVFGQKHLQLSDSDFTPYAGNKCDLNLISPDSEYFRVYRFVSTARRINHCSEGSLVELLKNFSYAQRKKYHLIDRPEVQKFRVIGFCLTSNMRVKEFPTTVLKDLFASLLINGSGHVRFVCFGSPLSREIKNILVHLDVEYKYQEPSSISNLLSTASDCTEFWCVDTGPVHVLWPLGKPMHVFMSGRDYPNLWRVPVSWVHYHNKMVECWGCMGVDNCVTGALECMNHSFDRAEIYGL